MTGIARTVQCKGRLRPSFFFCLLLCVGASWAQQGIYRCGREYTNTPTEPQRCERLALPAVTVIAGTQVQRVPVPASQAAASAAVPSARAEPAPRDDMARTILVTELGKARERHAQLLQAQRHAATGDGVKAPLQGEQLQAAIARTERDIDSLQRELARRAP